MANKLVGLATNVLEWTGFILQWTVSKLKYTVLRLSILSGIVLVLLWLSVFVFASFYWLYMPSSSHINKVHFDFEVCDEGIGLCSFPTANVSFGKDGNREEILRAGQVYRILINLEVPESPVNHDLGMFMVRLKMYDRNGKVTSKSSRSTVLHYQSVLLNIMKTLVLAPLLISGATEEKQELEIEMFPSYIDNYNHPSTGAMVEIQSKKIQLYTATLNIYAYFTGLRYYLFYWPVVSGIIGTLTNFIFFSIITLLSYLKYFYEEEDVMIDPVILNRRYSLFDRRVRIQAQLDQERGKRILFNPNFSNFLTISLQLTWYKG
ncbi:hypothetical protein LOTGIDRAFT_212437 [Lottia gigantea]|uniref:Seipin n=1 Tax=Lottia gigantea TaxID=225164 RepID=V4B5X5_LOTGI|nr:hypothetical protein LOTGIDRAFT_212437 [Lottia gigantea]ESP02916.1 hypothetical protein LOTGIDRAFT_212437 [Lottia gigantea]